MLSEFPGNPGLPDIFIEVWRVVGFELATQNLLLSSPLAVIFCRRSFDGTWDTHTYTITVTVNTTRSVHDTIVHLLTCHLLASCHNEDARSVHMKAGNGTKLSRGGRRNTPCLYS